MSIEKAIIDNKTLKLKKYNQYHQVSTLRRIPKYSLYRAISSK